MCTGKRISLFAAIALILTLFSNVSVAGDTTVFEYSVERTVAEVYSGVFRSLEEGRFFVVEELDIGKNLSNFSEKWGDDYNTSGLSAIRSIIFCNGWYANQVSNKDPKMLGLCPLHMTLIEKDGVTTALFNRPTVIAANSPAYEFLAKVEREVIEAIKKGMEKPINE
jgi:uncharacterized protein (DUF302 family)